MCQTTELASSSQQPTSVTSAQLYLQTKGRVNARRITLQLTSYATSLDAQLKNVITGQANNTNTGFTHSRFIATMDEVIDVHHQMSALQHGDNSRVRLG